MNTDPSYFDTKTGQPIAFNEDFVYSQISETYTPDQKTEFRKIFAKQYMWLVVSFGFYVTNEMKKQMRLNKNVNCCFMFIRRAAKARLPPDTKTNCDLEWIISEDMFTDEDLPRTTVLINNAFLPSPSISTDYAIVVRVVEDTMDGTAFGESTNCPRPLEFVAFVSAKANIRRFTTDRFLEVCEKLHFGAGKEIERFNSFLQSTDIIAFVTMENDRREGFIQPRLLSYMKRGVLRRLAENISNSGYEYMYSAMSSMMAHVVSPCLAQTMRKADCILFMQILLDNPLYAFSFTKMKYVLLSVLKHRPNRYSCLRIYKNTSRAADLFWKRARTLMYMSSIKKPFDHNDYRLVVLQQEEFFKYMHRVEYYFDFPWVSMSKDSNNMWNTNRNDCSVHDLIFDVCDWGRLYWLYNAVDSSPSVFHVVPWNVAEATEKCIQTCVNNNDVFFLNHEGCIEFNQDTVRELVGDDSGYSLIVTPTTGEAYDIATNCLGNHIAVDFERALILLHGKEPIESIVDVDHYDRVIVLRSEAYTCDMMCVLLDIDFLLSNNVPSNIQDVPIVMQPENYEFEGGSEARLGSSVTSCKFYFVGDLDCTDCYTKGFFYTRPFPILWSTLKGVTSDEGVARSRTCDVGGNAKREIKSFIQTETDELNVEVVDVIGEEGNETSNREILLNDACIFYIGGPSCKDEGIHACAARSTCMLLSCIKEDMGLDSDDLQTNFNNNMLQKIQSLVYPPFMHHISDMGVTQKCESFAKGMYNSFCYTRTQMSEVSNGVKNINTKVIMRCHECNRTKSVYGHSGCCVNLYPNCNNMFDNNVSDDIKTLFGENRYNLMQKHNHEKMGGRCAVHDVCSCFMLSPLSYSGPARDSVYVVCMLGVDAEPPSRKILNVISSFCRGVLYFIPLVYKNTGFYVEKEDVQWKDFFTNRRTTNTHPKWMQDICMARESIVIRRTAHQFDVGTELEDDICEMQIDDIMGSDAESESNSFIDERPESEISQSAELDLSVNNEAGIRNDELYDTDYESDSMQPS